jgi:hypothetical protein
MRLGWCGISAFFMRGGKKEGERRVVVESFDWKLSLLLDKCSLAFRLTSSQGIGLDALALDKTQQNNFLRALSRENTSLT